ncbi:MAG: serine/threonine protein kinase [Thermoleophilia bacterium]|nr:serine/threonine protein kinase [Thermoleophilia bacterium]
MLIDDRWELGPPIAKGSFGRVFYGTDTSGGPDVAIKLLHSDNVEAATRMARAARKIAHLQHPGIVPILAVTTYTRLTQTHPAVVMELVDTKRTVRDTIASRQPLPLDEAVELLQLVTGAVSHAHMNDVVHRDLKPENLLEDECGRPRIIDFDLAKFTTSTGATFTPTQVAIQMGSPPYSAPELTNAATATPAVDLYSLGVIFAELLTGTPTPTEARLDALPAEATQLIRDLVCPLDERIKNADELASRLAQLEQVGKAA